MGNEYRAGSVCGETRWNIPSIGFSSFFSTADLELETTFGSNWDVPDSVGYFMDPNPTITQDSWTQQIIFNSGGGDDDGGETNSQSQILQEQRNSNSTHDFHGGDPNSTTFFLDQIHTPNITYGLFSQQQEQQPIYENNPQLTNMAYHHPTNSLTDDQLMSNSPFISPSIFSGQAPPMWNTSSTHDDHFFPCSTSMTKAKKKNYNGDQPSLISKRPRLETPSPLPTFKVRKEKMGDRITALQQLVSPFGKTDTASVLHEAIDYIKFLHDQVNALSNPYLKNGNLTIQHQQMNEKIRKKFDLKSRGLCLVPISSTFPLASETTADFWTPATFGGPFSR